MQGIYRPRHPERTVLYRVLFHNFDRFLTVYEGRFEKEYGHFRPGVFHRLPHLDDSRLAEIFAREVLRLLVGKGLLSPEWEERILSWRHTGFNVHSRVRARTKTEAERIGKYMVRPILALDRLSFLENEGRVGYRHGDDGAELERMDYLELIARVTLSNSRRSKEGSGLPSFGRIPGWATRSAARRGPGPPDLKFLTLVPGRDILFL